MPSSRSSAFGAGFGGWALGNSSADAGGAEARGGPGSYPERIVCYRDLSPGAWREKVRFTVGEMERRLAEFEGVGPKTVEIFMREAARVWY